MPAAEAEQADFQWADVTAEAAEDTLAVVAVEAAVGAAETAAGNLGIGLDTVAVDGAYGEVGGSDVAAEGDAAFIGDAGQAVGDEVLEGEAGLTRKHEIGDLELAEHHADAGVEQVVVAEPGVLDDKFTIAAFLSHDAVEVVTDVFR